MVNTKNQELNVRMTFCSVNNSVVTRVNASIDGDYLQRHVLILDCILQVLYLQGTVCNYYCRLPGEESCTMRNQNDFLLSNDLKSQTLCLL